MTLNSTPTDSVKPFTNMTYEALIEFRDCFEPKLEKKGEFKGFF